MKFKLYLLLLSLVMATGLSAQTVVSMNGKLKLVGNQLSSECGNPVQLRGMSTHGVQWFGNCINNDAFTSLKNDWKCDIVRLALYVDEGGYLKDPSGWRTKIDAWVDQVGALGMYCMIDWHVLTPGDPNAHTTESIEFWKYMATKHKGKKHVLYEICNEPNGVNWGTIKTYANQVIPAIRAIDPETIIIVGTPFWSGKPGEVVSGGPLTGANGYNVMYTFHFYAASHSSYRPEVQAAAGSIPIFATEWGLSDASGNGAINTDEGQKWMDIFNGNNNGKQKISWCNWSFADKAETSAALTPGACANSGWNNTTAAGAKVKTWISSPAKDFKPCTIITPVVTAELTAPANNATYIVGANVTFKATATTTVGSISKVEYYDGNTLLGSATTSPYTFSTTSLTPGLHTITAKATDGNAVSATSASVKITINNVVVTSAITAPSNNASYNVGESVTLTATATTSSGTITKVEYYEGNTLLGAATSSPFTFSISTLKAGDHMITAKATDSNGATATSTAVKITINSSVVKTTISTPTNNTSVVIGTAVKVVATATTSSGTISKIEFYIDDVLVATDNSAPFEYTSGTTLSVGDHTFSAKAFDSNGSTDTATIAIAVKSSPLKVSLTTPMTTEFGAGAVIDLAADATTEGGTVTKVEFYVDGKLVSSNDVSPYSFSVSGLEAGSHTLYAKAFDSNNNSSTSATKTVQLLPSVFKVKNAPIIDGTIDGMWSHSSVLANNVTKKVEGTITNTADLSGAFKLLWDNTYLYVLGDIVDNTKVNDSPESYNDDAVEVYVDINNDKAGSYGANDVEYTFGWKDGVVIGLNPSERSSANVVYAIVEKAGGYVFEARIPWATLLGTPAVGQKVGFDFMINDDDDGDTRDGKLAWNAATDDAWQQPSLFGTVILQDVVPCPSPSATGTLVGAEQVCTTQGAGVMYSITSQANATYAWTVSGGEVKSGQGSNQVMVDFATTETLATVSVKETTGDGCSGINATKEVVISVCNGLEESLWGRSEIRVFPNPFPNNFTIDLGSANQEVERVELCDLQGRLLESYTKDNWSREIQLGSGLPNGQFVIHVIRSGGVETKPIIKLK